jgi:outer membrane murein-binding lipoprotein Lpp
LARFGGRIFYFGPLIAYKLCYNHIVQGGVQMDQKVMELLAEIYQMQTEMRTDVKELRTDVDELKTDVKELRTDQETIAQNVVKIITVVEHDVARKIGAIFDFREIQMDHNQKTGQALERIEAKVEVLQIETSNLRRIK